MRTTVALHDENAAYVDELSTSDDASNAQKIRNVIQHARDLDARVDDLEKQIDELKQKRDALEARLQEQEQRERERDQLENRVEELAIEVREERDRAPWPLGWVGEVREFATGDDESDEM